MSKTLPFPSRRLMLGVAVVGLCLLPAVGFAAWPQRSFNPHPDSDDLILPMPCGGSMVFRPIAVPVSGPLDDQRIVIGGTDDRFGLTENARGGYIAGGMPDAAGTASQSYYLAKYKVTAAQYQAMSGTCPQPDDSPPLPAAGINWYEANQFAASYSEWLLKSAPEALPKVGDVPSFLRLPTEIEWEYAARGGVAVSESEFRDIHFPMKDTLSRYAWYQGTQSANGKVQPLGLLQGNPLKLYDILGDLDELVLDPFQANKQGRLHGQTGGFVVKGGNYTTSEGDIRSSYRQEVPPFDGKGLRHSKTVGFRLALSSVVFSSNARFNELKGAWDQLSGAGEHAPASNAVAIADPRKQLAQILASVRDETTRKSLNDLSGAMAGQTAHFKEQQDRAARVMLRLGAFLGRKLHDDMRQAQIRETLLSSLDEASAKNAKAKIDADRAAIDDNLTYYLDNVTLANQEYSSDIIDGQIKVLLDELGGRNLLTLQEYAKMFVNHIHQSARRSALDRQKIMADLAGIAAINRGEGK